MGHKIENLFFPLKDWRPIATRYDRCPYLLLCNPPGRYYPLLVISPDPSECQRWEAVGIGPIRGYG